MLQRQQYALEFEHITCKDTSDQDQIRQFRSHGNQSSPLCFYVIIWCITIKGIVCFCVVRVDMFCVCCVYVCVQTNECDLIHPQFSKLVAVYVSWLFGSRKAFAMKLEWEGCWVSQHGIPERVTDFTPSEIKTELSAGKDPCKPWRNPIMKELGFSPEVTCLNIPVWGRRRRRCQADGVTKTMPRPEHALPCGNAVVSQPCLQEWLCHPDKMKWL